MHIKYCNKTRTPKIIICEMTSILHHRYLNVCASRTSVADSN